MCVTNVYVDRYPDGKEIEFRHTETCQYGSPGRPCAKLSTLENPVRNIKFNDPTTEYMITAHRRSYPQPPPPQHHHQQPQTPPRSAGSSSTHRRQSSSVSSEEQLGLRRRPSERKREVPALRPTRTHRKERIIIVDSPPTPRTPPQIFGETYNSVPNSPATPPYIVDGLPRERGRPVIVDERPMQRDSLRDRDREIIREREREDERLVRERARDDDRVVREKSRRGGERVHSVAAVVGGRRRLSSPSRERFGWESGRSSQTSFEIRTSRNSREIERKEVDLTIRERERERERERALELERLERAERKERERIADLANMARDRERERFSIDHSRTIPILIPESKDRERRFSTDRQLEHEARKLAEDRAREARKAEERDREVRKLEDRDREVRKAERKREERIRQQDEDIRRRPVVPVPPAPVQRKGILKTSSGGGPIMSGGLGSGDLPHPIPKISIDTPDLLVSAKGISTGVGSLGAGDRVLMEESEARRRGEQRDREIREHLEMQEDEALKQRLKERMLPKRRASVGPGNRRHRVLYDDGVYRWE